MRKPSADGRQGKAGSLSVRDTTTVNLPSATGKRTVCQLSIAGNLADYIPITLVSGNLRGICPNCECLIHRRVSLGKLVAVRGELEIAFPQASKRIAEIFRLGTSNSENKNVSTS